MAADKIFENLKEIDESKVAPGNYFMRSPEKYLTNVKVILERLTDPRMRYTSWGFRAYNQAFKVAIAHGDEARASVFAQRAYATRRVIEGEDNPNVQKAKEFAENPSSLHSCGKLKEMKWK
jgi:hypothetical protein